ncbi:MAG: hypothetical protein FWG58_03090 [Methanomassiliicoccaceae archaeon]|nr:hypothetical protein [Methanomassiliicoccaceae archaeon]
MFMPKLSELISEGKDIHLSDGKQKNIVIRRTKNGWTSNKEETSNRSKKGTSKSILLKEDPIRYVKKLYANQYKIVSPSGVTLDWK